jgi:hypothetical protein
MQTKTYDLHGIFRIYVEGNYDLINQVDIHIREFTDDKLDGPFGLQIKPFQYWNEIVSTSVDDWGFAPGLAVRKESRFAIKIMADRVEVYMDTLFLPINLLIQIVLLTRGFTFVHAAAVSFNNFGILVAAGPGVGKTSLVSQLVDADWEFLGDDLVIVGKKRIWSYPQSFSIYPYHSSLFRGLSMKVRILLRFIKLKEEFHSKFIRGKSPLFKFIRVVFNVLVPIHLNIDPRKAFTSLKISREAKTGLVLSLSKGMHLNDFVIDEDIELEVDVLASTLWHEWHQSFHEILLFDAYAGKGQWFASLLNQTREVLITELSNIEHITLRLPEVWNKGNLKGHLRGPINYLATRITLI